MPEPRPTQPPSAPLPADMAPVLKAALDAVDPFRAVQAALRREGDWLLVGDARIDLRPLARVVVVGAGKAGAPMAQAVEAVLGERVSEGLVVVKEGHGGPTRRIALREAGHPVPTTAGLEAGDAVLRLAEDAAAGDLLLCLLSGGGSALLESLPAPLTLDDLQRTTSLLLGSGATIGEMNAVRKHLSRVKGGRLAQAAAPARVVTLLLSDVVGSPLDVIASGPTVADASTWADAWAVVERYGLAAQLPEAVRAHLRAGLDRRMPDTPKPGDAAFDRATTVVVGDNAVAAEAAEAAARAHGWNPLILTTFLEGEAREAAKAAVAVAREVRTHGRPVEAPACLIVGGETTVTLGPNAGRGGRNQELALAAALALEGTSGITLVTLATDGTDGPTDAAGGIVDGQSVARAAAQGLDAHTALRGHAAYAWLEAAGALLRTGPTRTNVNDLLFVFITNNGPATQRRQGAKGAQRTATARPVHG